jgi:ATP-dependent DNA helicase RecQ
LELPFVPLVTKTRETPPQSEQHNSAQQHANVRGAFAVNAAVPPGPVLLIDDLVDSRWTLTVVAARLRHEGSGPVYPVVLAEEQSD